MSADKWLVAVLGLEVDSRPVDKASRDLDKLNAAAAKAEKATLAFTGGARQSTQQTDALAQATQRAERATMGATAATTSLAAAERNLERASQATTAAMHAQAAANAARMQSRQLMFQLVDIGQAIPLAMQSPTYALQNLGFQIAQIGQLSCRRHRCRMQQQWFRAVWRRYCRDTGL